MPRSARCLLALVAVAVAVAALAPAGALAATAPVRIVRVPGASEALAVDGGGAFVLRRTQRPFVVRVDLASGRRATVFATEDFPGDQLYAAGGVLAFDVDLLTSGSAVVTIPTAPGGAASVLRSGSEDRTANCGTRYGAEGVTAAGEVVVATTAVPCADPKAGVATTSVVGPAGERPLLHDPAPTLDDTPRLAALAGRWMLVTSSDRTVREVDTTTGAVHAFTATLADARMEATLGPDGRILLYEMRLRRHGGFVQRLRLVAPGDPPRGGRVIGTVGTPPRLQALFCGTRLVVLRTSARRTRVLLDGRREIARVSTPADPRHACDATRLVLEAGGPATRLAVVALPAG